MSAPARTGAESNCASTTGIRASRVDTDLRCGPGYWRTLGSCRDPLDGGTYVGKDEHRDQAGRWYRPIPSQNQFPAHSGLGYAGMFVTDRTGRQEIRVPRSPCE